MIQSHRVIAAGVLVLAAACSSGGESGEKETTLVAASEAPASREGGAPATGAMLDPNSATAEQLMMLPSMDSGTVSALVAGRPYANMLALNSKLTRLTEVQRDSVYTRLFLPIDINKATRQELELIPGVGPKMSHEFEEYRPWTSIGQFRREIGKYADSTEVARLERYIAIR